MSPRSRSRSITPRRYSRSPYRRNGRRSYSRRPPSPPPLNVKRSSARYSSCSHSCSSRSISPNYRKRNSSRRHYTNSRSRTKSLSRSRSKSRSRSQSSNIKNYRNTRDNPNPSRCIGVFGLNVHTTQAKIREIFEKFGSIERIQVVVDAQTGYSRGFCFIYYKRLADAKAACDHCCGMEVDGRRIRVAFSVTERSHTPTPGAYKGTSVRHLRRRRYRDQWVKRNNSPSRYSKSHRHRYERSRSRSYSPRHYRH